MLTGHADLLLLGNFNRLPGIQLGLGLDWNWYWYWYWQWAESLPVSQSSHQRMATTNHIPHHFQAQTADRHCKCYYTRPRLMLMACCGWLCARVWVCECASNLRHRNLSAYKASLNGMLSVKSELIIKLFAASFHLTRRVSVCGRKHNRYHVFKL